MSSDEAVKETHAVANFEESAEPAVLSAELERAVTLDFNPIMTPNPKQDSTRTMVLRTSEPLTQEQQFAQLANQSDLAGLPILGEDECQKSLEEVEELARVSRRMALIKRNRKRRIQEAGFGSHSQSLEEEAFKFINESKLNATSVAPLVQILQVGGVGIRMMLVDALSSIDGSEASRALADRALFDLSEQVRETASERLKREDRRQSRMRNIEASQRGATHVVM